MTYSIPELFFQNLTAADDVDIDITVSDNTVTSESLNVVDQNVAQSSPTVLTDREFLEDEPRTPLHEIVGEVRGIESESVLLQILNTTDPFDAQAQKDDILSDFFFDLYEKSRKNFETSESAEGDDRNSTRRFNDFNVNSNSLTEMVSKIKSVTNDNMLSDLLQQVSERSKELEK